MAKIKKGDREIEISDGDSIIAAAEELGVPFGCYTGVCGACEIEIIKGHENLTELTEAEKIKGMHLKKRLACQCKIKKGNLII